MVFILKISNVKIHKTNQSLMPLYKTITFNPTTKLLIWKIEEPFDVLSKNIQLTTHCQARVDSMKSDLHRRGFMSIRHLLAYVGYTDFDLSYDQNGKPHLADGTYISISHSYIFSAIISLTIDNVILKGITYTKFYFVEVKSTKIFTIQVVINNNNI